MAPVRSLRDLMQEEEQQLSGKKAETKETPSATTSKANKSGTPRKKLKYDTPPHYPFIKLDISHVLNVSRRTQFVTEHRCLITRLTSPKFHLAGLQVGSILFACICFVILKFHFKRITDILRIFFSGILQYKNMCQVKPLF